MPSRIDPYSGAAAAISTAIIAVVKGIAFLVFALAVLIGKLVFYFSQAEVAAADRDSLDQDCVGSAQSDSR